jgi:hypothetical protein
MVGMTAEPRGPWSQDSLQFGAALGKTWIWGTRHNFNLIIAGGAHVPALDESRT